MVQEYLPLVSLFLGLFFKLVELYAALIVIWFLVRIAGWPIRAFIQSITYLK